MLTMARVFKAKYFSSRSFFDINSSVNASFVWKGFLTTREFIKKGLTWRIGDGKNVNMWNDNWLPDRCHPKPMTGTIVGLENCMVNMLLNEGKPDWNWTLIYALFVRRDVDLIKRTPLSVSLNTDCMFWALEKNGFYSVR